MDSAVFLGVGGDILEEMKFCGYGLIRVVDFFDECDRCVVAESIKMLVICSKSSSRQTGNSLSHQELSIARVSKFRRRVLDLTCRSPAH